MPASNGRAPWLRLSLVLSVIAILTASLSLAPQAGSRADEALSSPAAIPPAGETITSLIVKYRDTSSAVQPDGMVNGQSFVSDAKLTDATEGAAGMHVVTLAAPVSSEEAGAIAAELERDPDVAWAEPNRIVRAAAYPSTPPDDTKYSSQWNLWDTYGMRIGTDVSTMTNAWSTNQGAGVTVAVIDTGYIAHPDLDNQRVAGYDFVRSDTTVGTRLTELTPLSNNDLDGDVLDTANYGPVGRDSNPLDPGDWYHNYDPAQGTVGPVSSSWHGTHVAGIIGAQTNNSTGIAGAAPAVKVQPIRALGWAGGYDSDIIDGIVWASGGTVAGVPANSTPAKVINLSLGGTGACGSAFQSAINAARARGSVVVAAAGNTLPAGVNMSNTYPANCTGVIAVAATSRSGTLAYYSNYGSGVSVSAPGGDTNIDTMILSTASSTATGPGYPGYTGGAPTPTYVSYQGTSMAAPHVSALAAMLKSAYPTLTPTQVADRIIGTTSPVLGSTCAAKPCGTGIINAQAALAVPVIESVSPSSGTVDGGTNVTLIGANFTDATSVTLGGAPMTFTIASPTSITFTTPSHDSGAVDISVATPNGTDTAPGGFTYVGLPQTVTWAPSNTSAVSTQGSLTPDTLATSNGPGSISYSVTNAGTTGCTVNAATAALTFSAGGSCIVTATASATPRYAQGTKAVTFTITASGGGGGGGGGGGSSSGGSSSGGGASGGGGGALQVITEVRPALGPISGGNHVAIIGYGFTGVTQVVIGSKPAAFTYVNDAFVDVVMPPGDALGSVDVSVVLTPERGRAFAPGGYVYVADPPPATTGPTVPPPGLPGSPEQNPMGAAGSAVPMRNPATARQLGGGVLLLANRFASQVTKTVAGKAMSAAAARAPQVAVPAAQSLRLSLRGLPAKARVTMRMTIGGTSRSLGVGTVGSNGVLLSPALRFTKSGTFPLQVRTTTGKAFYATASVRR